MGTPDTRPKGYWGRWWENKKFPSRLIKSHPVTGEVYSDVTSLVDRWYCRSERNYPSSNRRLPLIGSNCLWIPPSSYERSVFTYRQVDDLVAEYRQSPTAIVQTQHLPINFAQAAFAVKADPEFWDRVDDGRPTGRISVNRRSRLITECLLKIKDQKLNLSENLATAVQTTNMFAQKSSTFLKALQAARRKEWSSMFSLLGLSKDFKKRGSLSASYLEYIYGWKPLMQDIHGYWELLNEQLPGSNLVHAVRKLSKTRTGSNQLITGYDKFNAEWRYTGRDMISLSGKIRNDYARQVARAGLLNPLSVAWEVVPYSFLIDWGMPIGNALEALDATTGLDFVGGYISLRQSGTVSYRHEWVGSGRTTFQPGLGVQYSFSNVREKLTSFPFPEIYVKSPFSTVHLLNALALTRQLTRSR